MKDSLRHLYDSGFRRGYASARVDKTGLRAFIVAIGWFVGVLCGLVMTGWL